MRAKKSTEEIQRTAFPHRTVGSIRKQRERLHFTGAHTQKWGRADDERLLQCYADGLTPREARAEFFPARTHGAVQMRMHYLVRPTRPWSAAEAATLAAHVARGRSPAYIQRAFFPARSKQAVAAKIRELSGVSQSQRRPWTPAEDARLLELARDSAMTVEAIRDRAFPKRSVQSLCCRLHFLR